MPDSSFFTNVNKGFVVAFFVFLQGLLISITLFFTVNPQNSFILKQGVRNEYILPTCCILTALGIVLIQISFNLLSLLFEYASFLQDFGMILFTILLFATAAHRVMRALDEPCDTLIVDSKEKLSSFQSVVTAILSFFFSKPMMYIKDFLLLGALSFCFPENAHAFTIGAMVGIAIFFFGFGFLSKTLQSLLANDKVWKAIHFSTAIIMGSIGINILMHNMFK